MRRRRIVPCGAVFLILLYNMLLGGCALRAQAREADQLLVVQTMGLDFAPEGVSLSLASAAVESGGKPVRLSASGPSVTAAVERARAAANEEELFCSHLGQLVIGEEAARTGLTPLLDYICRADELRLSVPLYILRGGRAADAVLGTGDESFGVCDALRSVEADLRSRGDGCSTEAAEVIRGLNRRGSALICAVERQPSAEDDRSAGAGERPQTLVPAGYAVVKDGALCAFLDREQAVGVGFLLGRTGPCEITVTDQAGLPVTLGLTGGSCRLEPVWDENGALGSLGVSLEAEAILAEGQVNDSEETYLQRMLERTLAERVRQVLRLSKEQRADFLDLQGRLERLAPGRSADFAARWPTLPLTVSVSARLTGTGDREGGA